MLSVDNLFVFRFHRWNLGPHGSRGFSKEAQPTSASPAKKVAFLDELNSKFSRTCLVGILIFGWKTHVSCQIYKMTFCDTSWFWKMSTIGGPWKEPMFKKTYAFQILHNFDAFDTFQNKFPSKFFWIFGKFNPRNFTSYIAQSPEFSFETPGKPSHARSIFLIFHTPDTHKNLGCIPGFLPMSWSWSSNLNPFEGKDF